MLGNMKIRYKLLLLLLVPLLGLAVFSVREVADKYGTMQNTAATRTLTELAVQAGALVHELQKERGLSSGYINSQGGKFRDDLARQRERVDREFKSVQQYISTNSQALDVVKPSLDLASVAIGKLQETRSGIDSLKVEGKNSFAYYTDLIGSYTDVVAAVATTSKKTELMREAAAYYALVIAKEETGKERATLNAVIAAGSFNDETLQRTFMILAAQKNYLSLFRKFASATELATFDDAAKGPVFQQVEDLRNAVLAKHTTGDFGIAPETWFDSNTKKIDAMKGVEDSIAKNILATADALHSGARKSLIFSVALSTILGGAAVILGFMVMLGITTPLSRLLHMLKDIAEGEGDLTRRLEEGQKDELGELARWFNRFVDNIHGIVSQVSGNTLQVSAAAHQLNSTAEQIATAAEEVACQSVTVATASEEMSATSGDISRNCMLASEVANQATTTAREGADVVQEALSGMEKIAERVREAAGTVESLGARSDQIGAIVGTIEDIADQTNLLALNAAIEAARAGEQGRGFAVVADEVRALAERTTKATKEIGGMIKAIQQETADAVGSMENGVSEVEKGMENSRKSGSALEEILDAINKVTMQVHQIATAAEEQTAVTGEISTNIHQITDVVHETARGAHETATAASQLSSLAKDLQSLVGRFKLA
ncbi:methyl-accepting chemotaxis protein [Geobacter sp. SVR]|uniref:methyl-accepting chemotaxis protein n=1 Tax=Geobacter sp. SVR TaxID=2495594 RepID=UPI00143EF9DE|nr:methyl-accepting chemotaxis protein [Geobacter sp. SVR]BCS52041.1 methyl-accepting chemotaxis sensory transducer [Geobacter sp. SVR]GCF86496.1 methyl-accepting chemotaxis sensory transducer [Geobacter sp. SVR]